MGSLPQTPRVSLRAPHRPWKSPATAERTIGAASARRARAGGGAGPARADSAPEFLAAGGLIDGDERGGIVGIADADGEAATSARALRPEHRHQSERDDCRRDGCGTLWRRRPSCRPSILLGGSSPPLGPTGSSGTAGVGTLVTSVSNRRSDPLPPPPGCPRTSRGAGCRYPCTPGSKTPR